jgi:hypothetical protein
MLFAGIQNDEKEANRADCVGMPAGTRIVILSELPSDTKLMHISHVKAYPSKGGKSVTGYTVILTIP